jgi:hypothetical protein
MSTYACQTSSPKASYKKEGVKKVKPKGMSEILMPHGRGTKLDKKDKLKK